MSRSLHNVRVRSLVQWRDIARSGPGRPRPCWRRQPRGRLRPAGWSLARTTMRIPSVGAEPNGSVGAAPAGPAAMKVDRVEEPTVSWPGRPVGRSSPKLPRPERCHAKHIGSGLSRWPVWPHRHPATYPVSGEATPSSPRSTRKTTERSTGSIWWTNAVNDANGRAFACLTETPPRFDITYRCHQSRVARPEPQAAIPPVIMPRSPALYQTPWFAQQLECFRHPQHLRQNSSTALVLPRSPA